LRIIFESAELARRCNEDHERLQAYGPKLASALRRRLGEITAAEHLAELRSVPAARPRTDPVREDGSLLIMLRESADLRVRLRPEPPPRLGDGRLDEAAIRELLVSDVVRDVAP
jgi:plasmid maintenance system killer protein